MTGTLRVGVLLESPRVPAWVWTAIRELSTSEEAQLVVFGRVSGGVGRRGAGGAILRGLLERIDGFADRGIPPERDAFATRDATPLLAPVPVQDLRRLGPDAAGTFAANDVAALGALDLDVLLWFGDEPLRGGILGAARAGVWAVQHGDDRVKRGGPVGFWEVHEGRPITGAALQILAEQPARNRTLARASIATIPTSVRRTRNELAWTALPMLERTLRRLARDGVAAFLEWVDRLDAAPTFYSNRLYGSPTPRDLVAHAARRSARLARLATRTLLTRRQWGLYVGLADELVEACWRLRPLAPPTDAFWADPHVVLVGDRYFVFIEEVWYATGKGHISVIEVDQDGRSSAARMVLETPYHLSYPFVFEHDGAFFMIPESSANGTIDLYRAASFPDQWTFVEHLMTGITAVDATLLHEHDRWWLFASVTKYPGAGTGELHLYSSDRLIGGDWRLHPASPISADVRAARPAGAILRRNGRLYRPAQDGSGAYGRAIGLYEILELSDTAYREELVTTIEPNWSGRITRTHTLAHAGRLTVLDALGVRPRWTLRRSRSRPRAQEGAAPAA